MSVSGLIKNKGYSTGTIRQLVDADLERQLQRIEEAAADLVDNKCDSVIIGGSPLFTKLGYGSDIEMGKRLSDKYGVPVSPGITGEIQALKSLGIEKLVVATPHEDTLNNRMKAFLEASGFKVLKIKGYGVRKNADITDMDEHPYAWLKDEMADVWQGFDHTQVRGWLQQIGLVNLIVDHTGQSCCAESANPTLTDAQGHEAKISIFVATGTRRMAMREAVRENYSAVAKSGPACGCSPAASEIEEGCCGSSASSGGSCCSGTAYEEVTFATGYSSTELSAAPKEAADISLGCGNPLALAALKPGEVVLDVGSGGGLDAFLAAKKVGPTGRVIGVDMTPAMLERARASAERNGIANVEFRQGYAEELPVKDGEVDVIISNCVINLTEDKGLVFREAFRVLKPGGRLEVSDMVTSGPVPIELRESAAGWSECVSGALPEQEYLDLIAQAGFENVTTRRSPSSNSGSGKGGTWRRFASENSQVARCNVPRSR